MPAERPTAAKRGHRPLALVLCLALAAGAVAAPALGAQELEERFQYLLVGALIGEREVDTFEVVREADVFYLPVDSLLRLCGCELERDDEGARVLTPIGSRRVDPALFLDLDGVTYVSERVLGAEMGSRVEFIAELYALRFYFPWTPGDPLHAVAAESGLALPADDLPPSLGLSSVRLDALHSRRPASVQSQLDALVHGRVAGGRWRTRANQSLSGQTRLSEYAWTRTFGRKLVLAGHQRVNLHPLLGITEMTGVQGAWTNQPLEMFAPSGQPSELLPRSLQNATTVTGRGPAAGVAELRLDGVAVRRQTIRLDGTYEFLDVVLPSRQSTRIEVYVYDRFDVAAPLEVHDHTRGVSDQLLPAGASLVMGGVGRSGNYLEDIMGERSALAEATPSAFVQSRYGVSDRVTVEAALQTRAGHRQALVGLSGSIGRYFAGSAAVAWAEGAYGWDIDVQGYLPRWRVTARSQRQGDGFNRIAATGRDNHYAEVTYEASGSFDVSLIGSSRQDGIGERTQFVLPGVFWQPTARTWLRARPDFFGRYRFDFSWAVDSRTRFTASYLDRDVLLGASSSLSRSLLAAVSSEWHPVFGDRQTAQVSWMGSGRWQPGLTAGVRRTSGRFGLLAGAQAIVGPGILASAMFENDPRYGDPSGRRDPRLFVRLHTDLAFANGRLLSGNTYSLSSTRGAIGGRIVVPEGVDVDPAQLAGLSILIDGKPSLRTQRGGRYYIGNLRPGVYYVEIDPGSLPIELSVTDSGRRARVEPGAVTAVDFVTSVEYGFAGRVSVEDQPFAGALVELVSLHGEVMQTTRTDRFGLYRFDGVARGRYVVRLSADNAPHADVVWPLLEVRVVDYLFGQDLRLRREDIRERELPAGLSTGQGQGQGQGGR